MLRTRVKIFDEYVDFEDLEELINSFISNPENKVAKVNSIKIETYYDEDDDACLLAIINYELGD